ncbi:transposase family protein [Nonomuraea sp. MTCD27]|uniref:transposase family protein n=1 Tax=Nonomuraea sp. MTCD27 TaxID=1676747 RepID=UPI0035C07162
MKLLEGVSDGRSDQGRDHPVAAVLALAAAATVAGMKGYTAVSGWIADVPTEVQSDLYMRAGATPAARPAGPQSGASCRPPTPTPWTPRSVPG